MPTAPGDGREVLDLAAPERITFSYGFVKGTPIPPGDSQVIVSSPTARARAAPVMSSPMMRPRATRVRAGLSAVAFANVIANEVNAGAAGLIDEWFSAWHEPDARVLAQSLARISAEGLQFRDRFSFTDGRADLLHRRRAAHRTGCRCGARAAKLRTARDGVGRLGRRRRGRARAPRA